MKSITPIIKLVNIIKYYTEQSNDKKYILNGVNLNVYSGDFIVIRGESGSGKTTLLSILGLIDKEYDGEYTLCGEYIRKGNKSLSWIIQEEIRSKGIGFVFQEARLFDYINVKDNIYLPMHIHRLTKKDFQKKFHSQIEMMYTSTNFEDSTDSKNNYNKLLKRYPKTLSGGEEQRASILRAFSHNPIFILADEPTASLDKDRKEEIFEILKKLAKSGKTIIVVSHDEVFLKAPKVYELKDGKLEVIHDETSNTESFSYSNQNLFQKMNNVHQKNSIEQIPFEDYKFKSQQPNNVSLNQKFGPKILSRSNIWFGLKPRTGLWLQFKLVINDLRRNILFTILTVGALLIGSFQLTILESLRYGTDALLDEMIKRGSRLTRITIRPKDLLAEKRFPDKSKILEIPSTTHFIERREGIYRIKDNRGRIRKETMYGLANNDPEFDQLVFTEGDKFSSETSLEIIISERSIKRLFYVPNNIITDNFRKKIIGEKLTFSVARPVKGTTLNTDPEKIKFDVFSIKLSISGIVACAEEGRNFYFPLVTQLLLEKWRLDKTNQFNIPYDDKTASWKVSQKELKQIAKFQFAERAHIYVNDIQKVIPAVKQLSSIGYSPEAKIFDYKWVLDTRKLAELFLKGIVIIVAIIGGLVIFGNIQTSVRMRKAEIVLLKLLGMRDGDITLTYIWSAVLAAFIGTIGGFFCGYIGISYVSNYINDAYPNSQFCKLFANPFQFFAEILILGICLSIIASVYPSFQAGKTNPVEGFK